MEADMSKRTIMVLVVLTLFISVFSFFTVVRTMNYRQEYNVVSTPYSETTVGSGKVRLGVREEIQPIESTGQISLRILKD